MLTLNRNALRSLTVKALTARIAVPILGVLVVCWVYPALVFPHAATTNTVMFDREIVRILNEHCVMCHVGDGPAFSLATYEETWLRRDAIHDQTLARHMPPWAAVSGYGEFVNANELTLREKRFIVSWVEGLGPRNTGTVFLNVLETDTPKRQEIRAQIDFSQWELGAPDLKIELPATNPVAIRGPAPEAGVQRTLIDPGLTTERWLGALEFLPTDRSAIRAVVFTVEDSGQWLATWTPWHGSRRLPEQTGYQLVAGTKIVAEIHTMTPDQPLIEPGSLGLHFAEDLPPAAISDIVLVATGEVPADARTHSLHAEAELATDAKLLALWPALPASVESIEVVAIRPSGNVEILLLALGIPPEWPTPYIYETPAALPRGSRLLLTAHTSNSGAAPAAQVVRVAISTSPFD